jgi:hypothetical protein
MFIQLDSITAEQTGAARRSLEALTHSWGHEITGAPNQAAPAADTGHGDDGKQTVLRGALVVVLRESRRLSPPLRGSGRLGISRRRSASSRTPGSVAHPNKPAMRPIYYSSYYRTHENGPSWFSRKGRFPW